MIGTLSKDELLEEFKNFDANNDGQLTALEFKKLLRSLDSYLTTEETEGLIRRFDLNDDQTLSESEYMSFMDKITKQIREQMDRKLQAHFDRYDKDKDGYITAEEMYDVLVQTYPDMSIDAAEILIKDADLDKDNRVSLDEFRQIEF